MNFYQENEIVIKGDIRKIFENRKNGKLPYSKIIGEMKLRSINEDPVSLKITRKIIYPLKINKILQTLINCHKLKVIQEFFITDNKLITQFRTPPGISVYFSFDEEHIYEQIDDNIKVTRKCTGVNKIGKWIRYIPVDSKRLLHETEENTQNQAIEIIKCEIEQLGN